MLKSFVGFLALACALGCSKSESTFTPAPPEIPLVGPPLTDWQKTSAEVLRGTYEARASLDLGLYFSLTQPACDQTPALPPLLELGTRMVTYRRFPFERKGMKNYDQQLSVSDITRFDPDNFTMQTSMWSKSDLEDPLLFTGPVDFRKIPADDTSGRYRGEGTWGAIRVTHRAIFPAVGVSPILAALKEEMAHDDFVSHDSYTQGVFNFGNGEVLLAIMRKRILVLKPGEILAEIEIRLPREPGLYDVNCVAATAYSATVHIGAAQGDSEEEMELLFTSARFKDQGEPE
jgi:hypothetical protein